MTGKPKDYSRLTTGFMVNKKMFITLWILNTFKIRSITAGLYTLCKHDFNKKIGAVFFKDSETYKVMNI